MTPQVRGFAKQKSDYSLFKRENCERDTVKHENNKKTTAKAATCLFLLKRKKRETLLHFFPNFTSWAGESIPAFAFLCK